MIQDQLDIGHWSSVFPLAELLAQGNGQLRSYDAIGDSVSGPYDIAVLEQLRAMTYAADGTNIERVPADVFIWNRGEPTNRMVTKISGLPYWPAGRAWPTAPSGTAMNFMAQICFADSRDLVPNLPGEVLLLFAEGKQWTYEKQSGYEFAWGDNDERDSAVACEWVTRGDFPLVDAAEIPPTPWRIMPCYGTRYRTWDYPSADGFGFASITRHIPTVTGGTKIGGLCPWIQHKEDMEGAFLCSLGSVAPEISKSFPLINVPDPISYDEWRNSDRLMIGDVGMLYLFIDGHGDLRWTAQGH